MHRLVPQFILNNFKAGIMNGSFQAVGLFVDTSGFTVMTDALLSHGQHGAEVLAEVIHSTFGPLMQSVFERGGFVTTRKSGCLLCRTGSADDGGDAALPQRAASPGRSMAVYRQSGICSDKPCRSHYAISLVKENPDFLPPT